MRIPPATAVLKATVRPAWEGRPVRLVSPDTGQDRGKVRAFLVIRLAGRQAGEFAIDHFMLAFQPGFSLVNLHASTALNQDRSVTGCIGNLFDKDDELAKKDATGGRSLFVRVRHGFH